MTHKLNYPIRGSSLNVWLSFTNPSTYSTNHRIIMPVHWKTIHIAICTLLTQSLHPFNQIHPTKPTHKSPQSQTNSLTHTLTQSLIHSLIHSFFLLFVNSNTHSYPHSPIQSLAHKLTHAFLFKHSIPAFIHSSKHSLTYSYWFTHPFFHYLTN